MKLRGWLGAGAAVAAVAALAVWAFRPQPIPVETHSVDVGDFRQTVDEEGKTRVRDRYVVASPAAGHVDRIVLRPGDAVRAGDVVAVLRPSVPALRDARTVAELRERLGAAEADKLRADAELGRQRAAVELARFEADRAAKLGGQGFLSQAALDQARLMLAQQTQALKAAEFAQHSAEHALALARAMLLQSEQAQRGLRAGAQLSIRSPVGGQVLRVAAESEGDFALGAPLLEIGDVNSMEAVIEVLSQDALRIAPRMPVSMRLSPAAAALTGVVRRVEPSARTKISTLGVEEQRVAVIVDFDPPASAADAGATRPAPLPGDGYRVDASIVVLEKPAVPLVPVGALFRDGERWAVFVVEAGVARKRTVELGARNQRHAWAAAGVAKGDTVIVYPPDKVHDGARVAPR
jgi:HlyD family secretion protein